jgi:hypothetical protein
MLRLRVSGAVITGAGALAFVAGATAVGAAIAGGPVDSSSAMRSWWRSTACKIVSSSQRMIIAGSLPERPESYSGAGAEPTTRTPSVAAISGGPDGRRGQA